MQKQNQIEVVQLIVISLKTFYLPPNGTSRFYAVYWPVLGFLEIMLSYAIIEVDWLPELLIETSLGKDGDPVLERSKIAQNVTAMFLISCLKSLQNGWLKA